MKWKLKSESWKGRVSVFPVWLTQLTCTATELVQSFHQSMNKCPDVSNIWYTLLVKVYDYLSDINRKYVKLIILQKWNACCDVTLLKTSRGRIIHYPVTHGTTKVRCVLCHILVSRIKLTMAKDRTKDGILTIFWLHKRACRNWMTIGFLRGTLFLVAGPV